jgi:hypothetical protein
MGVDDEWAVVGECEVNHFEELAIASRTDHQHFGRVCIGVHIHDHECVLSSVCDLVGRDPMPTC